MRRRREPFAHRCGRWAGGGAVILPIAPAIDDVVEAHPESVQTDRDKRQCDTLRGIQFMPEDSAIEPNLILGPKHAVRSRCPPAQ